MNDTFGHSAGDTAIATVAASLKKASPDGSSIIRTGGDEFLVFCPLEKGSKEHENFGTILESELKAYNENHDNPFEVSASYGYVFLPIKEGMDSLDEYIEIVDCIFTLDEVTDYVKSEREKQRMKAENEKAANDVLEDETACSDADCVSA
jgi:diguanylate cyclase (GGDEF)-like protein